MEGVGPAVGGNLPAFGDAGDDVPVAVARGEALVEGLAYPDVGLAGDDVGVEGLRLRAVGKDEVGPGKRAFATNLEESDSRQDRGDGEMGPSRFHAVGGVGKTHPQGLAGAAGAFVAGTAAGRFVSVPATMGAGAEAAGTAGTRAE